MLENAITMILIILVINIVYVSLSTIRIILTFKGKKYIDTPQKYYFSDVGLRNARINFRQIEENHTTENIIYNELIAITDRTK